MITIQDQHLLCTNCGGKHLLKTNVEGNVRKVDAFKILHEDCTVKKIGVDAIVAAVEIGTNVPLDIMRQKTRARKIVDARRITAALLSEYTPMTRVQISEFLHQYLKNGKGDNAMATHYIQTDAECQATSREYRDFRAQITKWI